MKSRLVWSIFSLCALLVLVALAWISLVVLRLERSGEQARIESTHQDNIRVALWRLDSWFSPYLVRENARPYFEYRPYYSLRQAYGEHLTPTEAGEVLSPSPLLDLRSDILSLHFQIDPNGVMTSPQVPDDGFRELASETATSEEAIAAKEVLLEQLRRRVDPALLIAALSESEKRNEIDESWIAKIDAIQEEKLTQSEWADQGLAKRREYSQRAVASNSALQTVQSRSTRQQAPAIAQTLVTEEDLAQLDTVEVMGCSVITTPLPQIDTPQVGPLLPVWIDGAEPMPLLLRRVRVGDQFLIQGVLLDWEVLSGQLLAEAAELVPNARLQPVLGADRDFGEADFLASLPVALIAPVPTSTAQDSFTTERLVLVLVWIAALVALVAAGSTIAASMAFARKRSRFASSVTHELRTPLTTFQMYSEMLADGMVQDEAKRKRYLETLKGESKRLSALVENVLTWSRVEAGRVERRPSETMVDDFIAVLEPLLHHRCSESGVAFSIDSSIPSSRKILIDRDILERILFNLIDNACKYGASAPEARVELALECVGNRLRCTVSDNGPGIAPERHRSIFRPFEQGTAKHDPGDSNQQAVPGVGLGLALCKELARVLGGGLKLVDGAGSGAVFRLEIPC